MKKTFKNIISASLIVIGMALVPSMQSIAHAAGSSCSSDLSAVQGIFSVQLCSPTTAAITIINLMLDLLTVIAIGFIIYGGFQMVLSGGNEKKVTEARSTIVNAIIGLVIAILSFTIVTVVGNTLNDFGKSSSNQSTSSTIPAP